MRVNRRNVLAITTGAIAAIGVYLIVAGTEPATDVLVAVTDIQARSKIEQRHLTAVRIPVSAAHPQALHPDHPVNDLVSLTPIYAGQQVLTRHVTAGDNPVGAVLPAGHVAFLIPGSWEVTAGGVIGQGDLVDIMIVTDERRTGSTLARTLVRSVSVVDVRGEGGKRWTQGSRAEVPIGLLVEVTPRDAHRLALGLTVGRLFVSLTGGDDRDGDQWATLDDLFSDQDAVVQEQ